MSNFSIFLSSFIQKEPNFLISLIVDFFGFFLNIIFEFVYNFTQINSLGFSIILLTLFSRVIMLPLSIKSHKSMIAIQKLNPEVEKIRKKYSNSKDPEIQKKIYQETQMLYAKNGVNQFGGCLPMLLQMPIFLALNYIMQQPHHFIAKLKTIFVDQISNNILQIPNSLEKLSVYASRKIAPNSIKIDLSLPEDLAKVLNKLTEFEWLEFLGKLPEGAQSQINNITQNLEKIKEINSFFGFNLIEKPNLLSAGVLIPILTVVTTYLSSYVLNKMQKTQSSDQSVQSMQKSMLIVVPIIMGITTSNMAIGVGLYWICGNIFMLFQQVFINKYYSKKKENEI